MKTLDDIEKMPVWETSRLPAENLAQLIEDLVAMTEKARRLQCLIAAALAMRPNTSASSASSASSRWKNPPLIKDDPGWPEY